MSYASSVKQIKLKTTHLLYLQKRQNSFVHEAPGFQMFGASANKPGTVFGHTGIQVSGLYISSVYREIFSANWRMSSRLLYHLRSRKE